MTLRRARPSIPLDSCAAWPEDALPFHGAVSPRIPPTSHAGARTMAMTERVKQILSWYGVRQPRDPRQPRAAAEHRQARPAPASW